MVLKVLFIVFISIFTITAIITLLGITNLIKGIREKYLTPLFTALILEVIASVVLLFKNQDFSNNKTIPDILYQKSSIIQSASINQDCYNFIKLINKGEVFDSIIEIKNKEIETLKKENKTISENNFKDFYYYIQQIERLRIASGGSIKLQSDSSKAIQVTSQLLFLNGRLPQKSNTCEEVLEAFKRFKMDNHRTNRLDKIYLQDVPLFIKEYLEENYELNFYISNPNIPESIIKKND
jgi:hypothetical protein